MRRGPLSKVRRRETLGIVCGGHLLGGQSIIAAYVECPFHIVKNLFGHRKVRHRGLTKNGHQPTLTFENSALFSVFLISLRLKLEMKKRRGFMIRLCKLLEITE
jgi:hypothetical protein